MLKVLIGFAVAIAMAFSIATEVRADPQVCWKTTYGRGGGTVPGSCDILKLEKSGLLCYPKCLAGYTGVAFACWQNCPSGFRDDGAYCAKPGPYGRGVGYPWKLGDPAFDYSKARDRCKNDKNSKGKKKHPQGCEKNGLIWYPKCNDGFHAAGSNICSPNCINGMTDIGVSCQKKTYTRKTILPSCGSGLQYDAGLCYKKCKLSFSGVGPVCWQHCPKSHPYQCGALCGKTKYDCDLAVTEQVLSIVMVAVNIALIATTGGAGNAAKQSAKIGMIQSMKLAFMATGRKITADTMKIAFKILGQKTGQVVAKQSAEKWTEISIKMMATNDLRAIADSFELEDLDPTGIAGAVKAYNKPMCGVETVYGTNAAVVPGSFYTVNNKGQLLYYRHNAKGIFNITGKKIGSGWGVLKFLGATNTGALYVIDANGKLKFYRHDARGNWSVAGKEIGKGWGDIKHFLVAREGHLYTVRKNGGLYYYRHNKNFVWDNSNGRKIGSGFAQKKVFSGGMGVIYIIKPNGELRYYYHDSNFRWKHANLLIGSGWGGFTSVSSAGNGELYALNPDGKLLFYRHDVNKSFVAGSGNPIGFGFKPGKYGLIASAR